MLGILYYEGNAIYDGLEIREESKKKRIPHQKELSNKYFTQAFQKIYLPAKAGFSLAQIHVAFASYTEYLPKRNIGEKTIQKINVLARASDVSLYRSAAEIVTTDELKPRSRAALANLMTDFSRWRSLSGEGSNALSHVELAEILLD